MKIEKKIISLLMSAFFAVNIFALESYGVSAEEHIEESTNVYSDYDKSYENKIAEFETNSVNTPVGDMRRSVEWADPESLDKLPSGRSFVYSSSSDDYQWNCSYMYSMLKSNSERSFYDRLLAACKTVDTSTKYYESIPLVYYSNVNANRAMEVAWIFRYDHPEFFWMASSLKYNNLGLSFNVLPDFYEGADRKSAKTTIMNEAKRYINGALKYNTAHSRAKYLYNELRKNVSYQKGNRDQTIASVFLDKKTVCAGYALAYEMLCNAVGINTVVIAGYVHGWNLVCFSDKWYIVDVTNGYFLLSDKQMHSSDVSSGVSYTTKNSKGEVVKFYMHDVDKDEYPTYVNEFPSCDFSYNGIDGKDYISAIPKVDPYSKGDVSGNGMIDILDAIEIAKYLIGKVVFSPIEMTAADYDNNGKVDILDAVGIAQYLLKR